jgi:N-acetylglucosaminyldiphosphoundecaprenol N-acetyl-beta-D-mannosaminyltransferase
LVAFGVPRQELWLAEHRDRLRPPVRMGVGGLFDFYSGRIPRAPLWLREIGLEWIWRLAQEPGRMWRRYLLGNPLFLYRVWRQACRETRR